MAAKNFVMENVYELYRSEEFLAADRDPSAFRAHRFCRLACSTFFNRLLPTSLS